MPPEKDSCQCQKRDIWICFPRLTTDFAKCEGGRPSCAACARTGLICEYEHGIKQGESRNSALKRQLNNANKRIGDFTKAAHLLKSASSKDVEEMVGFVRHADDPAEALCTLPNIVLGRSTTPEVPIDPALAGVRVRSLVQELYAKHPSSFPLPAYEDASLKLQDASTQTPLLNARYDQMNKSSTLLVETDINKVGSPYITHECRYRYTFDK